MRKILFFDYENIAISNGFKKTLHKPKKHPKNPLMLADKSWETSNFTMYGSVVYDKEAKQFKLWYTSVERPWQLRLYYATSEDGIRFTRPELQVYQDQGQWTNRVHPEDLHGAAIILDEAEKLPKKRYKMLAGIAKGPIHAFYSEDGIDWERAFHYPAIPSDPDCPIGLCRLPDGRYLATHRLKGEGRRAYLSESWDFRHWSEPRLVYEPDSSDPPLTQVYGLGITPYGGFLLGTSWLYHVDDDDWKTMNGYQETELIYARSAFAWHRIKPGEPFLKGAIPATWESGNLQAASSPIYLENEIRFYYAATTRLHSRHWELEPQKAGLGMATLRPDGFVSLDATDEEAYLQTRTVTLLSDTILLNAKTSENGYVKIRILDRNGATITTPKAVFTGDSLNYVFQLDFVPDSPVYLAIQAKNASVYSIALADTSDEQTPYHQFRLVKGARKGL